MRRLVVALVALAMGLGALASSPPASAVTSWDYANDPDWLLFGTWTYPVTNRLLIEARGHRLERLGQRAEHVLKQLRLLLQHPQISHQLLVFLVGRGRLAG